MKRNHLLLITTLYTFGSIYAQNIQEHHVNLDSIIISVPKGTEKGNTPIPVTHKTLNNPNGNSMGDVLSTIPGVEQIQTGRGISKPVIRGVSGNRVVTYAQGIRVENQQWGSDHSLGVGLLGLSRVEVIKGAASLLYGSDALGGVLYFINEPYAKKNHISGFSKTSFLSNSLGTRTEVGLKTNVSPIKWNIFGAFESHADYTLPQSDQRVVNTRFNEQNIKANFGYSWKKWTTDVKYDFLKNKIGIVESQEYGNSTSRTFNAPYQDVQNHQLSWNNTYQLKNSKIEATLGYTHNDRKEFEEEHPDEAALDLELQTYSYDAKWRTPLRQNLGLVIGSQGMLQENKNGGEERLIPDAETKDIGIFSVINKDLNNIQLQGGLRLDLREIDVADQTWEADGNTESFQKLDRDFTSFNYSLGGSYKFSSIKLSLNASSGFRAPNTSELLANGAHHGANRFIVGDKDLDSENATQIDFGLDYDMHPMHLSANVFYNNIKNYIYQSPTGNTDAGSNLPIYNYLQTDARFLGGEVGYHYHPNKIKWLHVEQAFSMVWAEDKNNDPLPLIPPAKINTKLIGKFNTKKGFHLESAFARYVYHFKQNRTAQNESSSSDYGVASIGLNFKLEKAKNIFNFNMGVNNLTDRRYIDHLSGLKSQGIPAPGINGFINIGITFDKPVKKTDS